MTEPWRFRVLGPETFERLVAAGEPNERSKLGRAPTLVVASAKLTGDDAPEPRGRARDRRAPSTSSCSPRTPAASPRTGERPKLLQTPEGRAAVGLEDDEEFVALIHLGDPVTQPMAKPRKDLDEYVQFLA